MLSADKTSPEEVKRLEMLSFRLAINGLATVSWNVVMSAPDISVPVAVSRFAQSSLSSRTQFQSLVKQEKNVRPKQAKKKNTNK